MNKYQAEGFTILGFPSNQHGSQAPGSSECERAFGYLKMDMPYGSFPIFDKVEVNGPQAAPVYQYLKAHAHSKQDVGWNYEKFLVDGAGRVVGRYGSQTRVSTLEGQIQGLLQGTN
mmetsp:Transcript_62304/g.182000  ORF Transcript_62304/g.182000 Transcript_62304/m.182000 type:complete len:116 (-) Transcript_62304:299-646(-)